MQPFPRESYGRPDCRRLATLRGTAVWVGDLDAEGIRELLRLGRVTFVIDRTGPGLEWQDEADCFEFWKREVHPHLAGPDQRIYLEEWPGEYAYFASQWDDGGLPIILLTMVH